MSALSVMVSRSPPYSIHQKPPSAGLHPHVRDPVHAQLVSGDATSKGRRFERDRPAGVLAHELHRPAELVLGRFERRQRLVEQVRRILARHVLGTRKEGDRSVARGVDDELRAERPLSFAGKRERTDGDDRAVVAEFDRVCVRVENGDRGRRF